MSEEADVDDEIVVKVSDYVEGGLQGAERDEVAKKIETDPAWKKVHDEMVEARKFISGSMRQAKQKAPETFTSEITNTIAKRSGGRFFGRKTLGDRVPFNVLLVVAIIALASVGYLMWASQTGSLKVEKKAEPKQLPEAPVKAP